MASNTEISIEDFKIAQILSNDLSFCKEWKPFCKMLELDNSIITDLERKEHHNIPIRTLIMDILSNWSSTSPSTANTNILAIKLRELKCQKSAESIESLCGTKSAKFLAYDTENGNLIWFNTKTTTKFYSGRGKEMIIIQTQWKLCFESKRTIFVTITGLGGIGKSELARNYAKEFHETVKGHCIWIDAETNETLTLSFKNLAKEELKLSLKDTKSGKEKDLDVLVKEIYGILSQSKCLFIFDNLESYSNATIELLTELMSKQPPNQIQPLIITTSRYRCARASFGSMCFPLELDILDKDSAIDFFTNSLNLNKSSITPSILEAVEKLCDRLQNYPLAMQQAASFINDNLPGTPRGKNVELELNVYLDKIEKEAKRLLDHPLPQYENLEKYSKTTYLTWKITIDKIKETTKIGKEAMDLMNIISLLSPDNISTDFLHKIFEAVHQKKRKSPLKKFFLRIKKPFCGVFTSRTRDHSEFHKMSLELLKNNSMINLAGDDISIHRLVQEVTRIKLEEHEKLDYILEKLIISSLKLLKSSAIPANQMTHVKMVWKYAEKSTDQFLIKEYTQFPILICSELHGFGNYSEAYDFSCDALPVLNSVLGEGSRETLILTWWKGLLLEELGNYKDSLQIQTVVYEKQKKLFGEEDHDCLETASKIGQLYRRLEKYDEALKWYEDILKKWEKINGKDHWTSLQVKNNIAVVLKEQGKVDEALRIHEEVLDAKKRKLGASDTSTLTTKQNMASLLQSQKKYKEALSIFEEILKNQEKVLTVDHQNILNTKLSIAAILKFFNRSAEGLELAKEVHRKREKTLGPNHPKTVNAKDVIKDLEKNIFKPK